MCCKYCVYLILQCYQEHGPVLSDIDLHYYNFIACIELKNTVEHWSRKNEKIKKEIEL